MGSTMAQMITKVTAARKTLLPLTAGSDESTMITDRCNEAKDYLADAMKWHWENADTVVSSDAAAFDDGLEGIWFDLCLSGVLSCLGAVGLAGGFEARAMGRIDRLIAGRPRAGGAASPGGA